MKETWNDVRISAPAKINLHLAVGNKQPDGFHEISSVFCTTGLCDTVRVRYQPASVPSVTVTGVEAYCAPGSDTMAKAALAWMGESGVSLKVTVDCVKRIPVQAGLGGGSSDAAAVLRALDRFHPIGEDRLATVACAVGSDVSFFVSGYPCAYVTGRGERVEPLSSRAWHVCLVMPRNLSVSTGLAYRALDAVSRPALPSRKAVLVALAKGLNTWDGIFRNDFLSVVDGRLVYQQLAELQQGLDGYGSLSGSGACWFFLSEKKDQVDAFCRRVTEVMPCSVDTWVVSAGSAVVTETDSV